LSQITSAYNFVPLAQQVVCPPWQTEVSHDLPLQDGLCAELEIELTAHTPILVGRERDAGAGVPTVRFHEHPDGTPAIPGSTVRGAIRNVLEVATFARMQMMDNTLLSLRDLYLKAYTKAFVTESRERRGHYSATPLAGWLVFNPAEGQWQIHERNVIRIEHEELEKIKSKTNAQESVRARLLRLFAAASGDDQRFAKLKYDAVEGQVKLALVADTHPRAYSHSNGRVQLLYRKGEVCSPAVRNTSGYLVLTGQPGPIDRPGRDHKSGTKHMEFVFEDLAKGEAGKTHRVATEVMSDFRQVYRESSDLRFLESKDSPHANRGVPVFFLKGSKGQVAQIGLSQMFRLPAKFGLAELAASQQRAREAEMPLDFVETLFGHVSEEAELAQRPLRGRVSFGDCRWAGGPSAKPEFSERLASIQTVLAQPKPSFYPSYLQQSEQGGQLRGDDYQTVLSEKPQLRGWKRYPVRSPGEESVKPAPAAEQASNSKLRPLVAQTRFKGKIRLHNVKPEELGAIVWALTWGGKPELRHALGMGKPFGLGSTSIRITAATLQSNDPAAPTAELPNCQSAFEAFMAAQVGNWANSEALKELLAMADPARSKGKASLLQPLRLEMTGPNEFANAKKAKDDNKEPKPRLVLQPYSRLTAKTG
jgi:CRISPR-associated protein (TIGR03986 family)